MIAIDVKRSEAPEKEAEKSLSHQRMLREAKDDAAKKMSVEKSQRLRKAGLVK
jgi:hypothetical protein